MILKRKKPKKSKTSKVKNTIKKQIIKNERNNNFKEEPTTDDELIQQSKALENNEFNFSEDEEENYDNLSDNDKRHKIYNIIS